MKSPYFSEIHRLVNEYRGMMNEAERLHDRYVQEPNYQLLVDESHCYQTASEICGRLAQLYAHSDLDRKEWLSNQAYVDRQLRVLVSLATNKPLSDPADSLPYVAPAPAKTAKPAASASAAPAASVSASRTQSQPTAQKGQSLDGISNEVVASWFRESPKHGFEAVSGMEDLVKQLKNCVRNVAGARVKEHMGVGSLHSFFLYGPPGCGKTFVINAFVHELMKQGYSYMFLSGGDIHDYYVSGAERRVERAFQEAQNHAPCILFIDEIDNVCRNRNFPNLPNHAMATTTAFLNAYNSLVDSGKQVIFIGATNYPDNVDTAMLDRIKLIQVPLPDLKARANKFRMCLDGRIVNEPGLTYEDMAEETYNYSYRDFGRLIEELTDVMTEELSAIYGEDGDAMVNAMVSGEYLLRRDLFMKVLSSYHPSKKDEMIASLDAWYEDLQAMMNN